MDTYYQLIDRDTSSITIWWKALHIIYFIIAIVSGFTTAYVLGRAVDAFGDNCILNASITFVEQIPNTTEKVPSDVVTETTISLAPINMVTTDWGTANLCYFCQFTPLMCMINAVVWGTFFIICAKGGAGYISDMIYGSWRIVYPALLFTGIATILMLISSITLQEGAETFCAQFETIFGTKRCTYAIDDYTIPFNKVKRSAVVYLQVAVYSSYICFGAWLLQLGTLILRITCIVDFQLIKITVWATGKETVQKVINPDKSNVGALVTVTHKEPVAVALKPSQSPDALRKMKVSFIDESPTAENIERTPSLSSIEQREMLLADMHNRDAEYTDNAATTSFSMGQDHKKSDSPSPIVKDKKPEIVPNVNPILNSLPNNTFSNASSASSKKTVQKVINPDKSNVGALVTITQKQPVAVVLKPSQSSNALGKMKVSFIDESPTSENIKRTPSLTSADQREVLLAHVHKRGAEYMVNTATTSASVRQDHKKTDPPFPTAKDKKPGIVANISPTLNSFPSNTSSNASSTSSKEVVQKAINLDKSGTVALATVREKQPVAVPPKSSQYASALGKMKEEEVLPVEVHKKDAEYMDNTASTLFPVEQKHKRTDSSFPTAKNKHPGMVINVSPTLNSLPSNTSSNSSSTFIKTKEAVQKGINSEKQPVAVPPKPSEYSSAIGNMKEEEVLPVEVHKRDAKYMDNTASTSFSVGPNHKKRDWSSPTAKDKKPGIVTNVSPTLNFLPSNTSSNASSTFSKTKEAVQKGINPEKQPVAVPPKPSEYSSAIGNMKEEKVLPVELHKRDAKYMDNTASTSFSVGPNHKKRDWSSPTAKDKKPGIVTNVSPTLNFLPSNTSSNASSTFSKTKEAVQKGINPEKQPVAVPPKPSEYSSAIGNMKEEKVLPVELHKRDAKYMDNTASTSFSVGPNHKKRDWSSPTAKDKKPGIVTNVSPTLNFLPSNTSSNSSSTFFKTKEAVQKGINPEKQPVAVPPKPSEYSSAIGNMKEEEVLPVELHKRDAKYMDNTASTSFSVGPNHKKRDWSSPTAKDRKPGIVTNVSPTLNSLPSNTSSYASSTFFKTKEAVQKGINPEKQPVAVPPKPSEYSSAIGNMKEEEVLPVEVHKRGAKYMDNSASTSFSVGPNHKKRDWSSPTAKDKKPGIVTNVSPTLNFLPSNTSSNSSSTFFKTKEAVQKGINPEKQHVAVPPKPSEYSSAIGNMKEEEVLPVELHKRDAKYMDNTASTSFSVGPNHKKRDWSSPTAKDRKPGIVTNVSPTLNSLPSNTSSYASSTFFKTKEAVQKGINPEKQPVAVPPKPSEYSSAIGKMKEEEVLPVELHKRDAKYMDNTASTFFSVGPNHKKRDWSSPMAKDKKPGIVTNVSPTLNSLSTNTASNAACASSKKAVQKAINLDKSGIGALVTVPEKQPVAVTPKPFQYSNALGKMKEGKVLPAEGHKRGAEYMDNTASTSFFVGQAHKKADSLSPTANDKKPGTVTNVNPTLNSLPSNTSSNASSTFSKTKEAVQKGINPEKQHVAVPPKPSEYSSAIGNMKEEEVLPVELHKRDAKYMDNTASTSFSVGPNHKKRDWSSPTAKDRKPGIVTNVSPTLNSLPSNTSSYASSTFFKTKEAVQKGINPEKQPVAVPPKPSEYSSAIGKMKEEEVLPVELHKRDAKYMDNTASTFFSVGPNHKKRDWSSPMAKDKKPGIVTNVSPTLNSLSTNTASNAACASSKKAVQKAINLDKSGIGALVTVPEKQPVAVTPKPFQYSNALGKMKEGKVLPAEGHKRGAEYMDNTASTSFFVGQAHKKADSLSPTANDKKPGTVTNVNPTLNSLPSNTSSNASSTFSKTKEAVQKGINPEKQHVAVPPKPSEYSSAIGNMKEEEVLPVELHKRDAKYMDNTASTSFSVGPNHKKRDWSSPTAKDRKPGIVTNVSPTLNSLPSNTSSYASSTFFKTKEAVQKGINPEKQPVAVPPKPSEYSSAIGKMKEEEVLPVELHKRDAKYMDNTASTFFSVGPNHKKRDWSSPMAKDKKPGIVTNVSPTLNSLSTNTASNAACASSKKAVQKAINLDKSGIGALVTVPEKQPVAVTPKPFQYSNALGKMKEGKVLPAEGHKRGAEYMDNTASTSFFVGQAHKKADSLSPTANDKKPGTVTNVNPTLNSLPSNTSSNTSSTSS